MSVVAAKIGLWVLLAIVIFQLLLAPAIWDAILLFVAAGDIPGTNVSLSPDSTLILTAGLSIGIMAFIYRKRLFEGLIRRPVAEVRRRQPRLRMPKTARGASSAKRGPSRPALVMRSVLAKRELIGVLHGRLKELKQPLTVQGVAVRDGFAVQAVRFDQWLANNIRPREMASAMRTRVDRWMQAFVVWIHERQAAFDRWLSE